MRVASIGTTEQLANMLTKALLRELFCELRDKLGLVKIKQTRKVLGGDLLDKPYWWLVRIACFLSVVHVHEHRSCGRRAHIGGATVSIAHARPERLDLSKHRGFGDEHVKIVMCDQTMSFALSNTK